MEVDLNAGVVKSGPRPPATFSLSQSHAGGVWNEVSSVQLASPSFRVRQIDITSSARDISKVPACLRGM